MFVFIQQPHRAFGLVIWGDFQKKITTEDCERWSLVVMTDGGINRVFRWENDWTFVCATKKVVILMLWSYVGFHCNFVYFTLKRQKRCSIWHKAVLGCMRLQTDLKYHFERNFELQSSLYHQFRIAPCISPVCAYCENSKKIWQNMLGKSGETPQPRKIFEFRGTSHCRLQTSTFLKITSNILFHIFSQC